MEPNTVDPNSLPYRKANLSRRELSRRGTGRGLFTSTQRSKTTTQPSSKHQSARPSVQQYDFGKPYTERRQSGSLAREDQEESRTAPNPRNSLESTVPSETGSPLLSTPTICA